MKRPTFVRPGERALLTGLTGLALVAPLMTAPSASLAAAGEPIVIAQRGPNAQQQPAEAVEEENDRRGRGRGRGRGRDDQGGQPPQMRGMGGMGGMQGMEPPRRMDPSRGMRGMGGMGGMQGMDPPRRMDAPRRMDPPPVMQGMDPPRRMDAPRRMDPPPAMQGMDPPRRRMFQRPAPGVEPPPQPIEPRVRRIEPGDPRGMGGIGGMQGMDPPRRRMFDPPTPRAEPSQPRTEPRVRRIEPRDQRGMDGMGGMQGSEGRRGPQRIEGGAPAQVQEQPAGESRRRFLDRLRRDRNEAPAETRQRAGDQAPDGERRSIFPDRGERQRWRQERREAERGGGFINLEGLRQRRQERRVEGGRSIIEEPDQRRIIRSGDRAFIIRDETRRFRRHGNDVQSRRRIGGGNVTTIVRPNGMKIISETAPDGRLIRRYRRDRSGREHNLIDNRRTWRKWGAIGAGAALAAGLLIAIDPPRYRGPRERYIIEYDNASYDDVYDALRAPPIEDLGRTYTLDEVLGTYNLRERMRRIDLDSITFEFGSWQVDESQYARLERVARALGRIIDDNPDEVFLIEGHTDAVGDDVDNLSLSDRRAEEVANILTEEFDIPPENLVTQGYGEQHLKIDTDGPERANRRVTVRRITPLIERRLSGRYRD